MGSICIKVAKRIAADRHSLKELVERAAQDEHLRGLAEKHSELNYIVLYDALDRGLRVRLHRFTEGMEDIPHNHRFNFSSAILKGSYVHTIYETTPLKEDGDDSVTWTLDQPERSHPGAELQDQKELSLRTLISGVQIAGSSYSMYHNTIHKVAMPDENAFSLFIRGPAMQECSLQFVTESNTFRWKFGRGQESEAVVSSRVMSEASASVDLAVTSTPSGRIEIELSNGHRIIAEGGFDADMLARLLKGLLREATHGLAPRANTLATHGSGWRRA